METLPYLVPEFPEENLSPTSVVTPSPLVPPKPAALITPDKEVEPLRRGLAEAFEKSLVEEKPGIEDDDGYSPAQVTNRYYSKPLTNHSWGGSCLRLLILSPVWSTQR